MLGHDVSYSIKLDDAQLMAMSKKEKRVLLTRDLELYKQAMAKGIESFYLERRTEEERLAELARRFDIELNIDLSTSRCPKCNTKIEPTPKEEVANEVQRSTFENYEEFWKCPKCQQIYWQGAHWARIQKTLETARNSLKTEARK